MTKEMKQHMADAIRKLEVVGTLQHYEEYRDVLLPAQNVNYRDIADAFTKITKPIPSLDDMMAVNATLKQALQQPIMSEAYAAKGIKPQEVGEYVDSVIAYYPREKEALLRGFTKTYREAADTMEQEVVPTVDGSREWILLGARLKDNEDIAASMSKFVESKTPVKEEPAKKLGFGKKVLRWIEEKIPGAKTVAAGFVVAVAVTPGLKQMMKVWDKQADKTEVVAKNDAKQTQAQDASKMYQMKVVKDGQHQA